MFYSMTLAITLQNDFMTAFKARDTLKKETLNYVIAQIKNKKIDVQRDLTDDEVIALIKKEIKSINETLEFANKSGNIESVDEERQKMTYLSAYLPTMLDEQQLKKLIGQTMTSLAITDIKTGRGIITKALMETHRAVIDGAMMNQVIMSMM